MLYANYLVKIFFSSAANLWSFCICFTLKRTWCKCNQHIKVHLSLEDKEQEGSLPHLSLCHLPGDLGAIHSWEVLCLDVILIIIPSFCLPIADIPSLPQGTQAKSAGLKHFAAGVLARWLWRRRWQEVVGTGTGIHTGLSSTEGTNVSCSVEMVKSKGKIFSLRGDGLWGFRRAWVDSIQVTLLLNKNKRQKRLPLCTQMWEEGAAGEVAGAGSPCRTCPQRCQVHAPCGASREGLVECHALQRWNLPLSFPSLPLTPELCPCLLPPFPLPTFP